MAIICPECGEEAGTSTGLGTNEAGSLVARYLCEHCEHEWFVPF